MSYYSREIIPLDRAAQAIPALLATPHQSRSDRYQHIPTMTILRALQGEGFNIHGITAATVRSEDKKGFQKHLIRLRRADMAERTEAPEIVLINSHDGSTCYQLLTGMIRFACANGLIVGDKWQSVKVRHSGADIVNQVIEGTYSVVETFDKLTEHVDTMKQIQLAPAEQEEFARAALSLRYDEENPSPVQPRQMLSARRREDVSPDLWTTFNRVQENMIKGGPRGVIYEPGKRPRNAKVHAVSGIDQNVKLNRALFSLAEGMAKLKAA